MIFFVTISSIIIITGICEILIKPKWIRLLIVLVAMASCCILSNHFYATIINKLSWSTYLNGFNVVISELKQSSSNKDFEILDMQFGIIDQYVDQGLYCESDMALLISDLLNIKAPQKESRDGVKIKSD